MDTIRELRAGLLLLLLLLLSRRGEAEHQRARFVWSEKYFRATTSARGLIVSRCSSSIFTREGVIRLIGAWTSLVIDYTFLFASTKLTNKTPISGVLTRSRSLDRSTLSFTIASTVRRYYDLTLFKAVRSGYISFSRVLKPHGHYVYLRKFSQDCGSPR
jgi:hypothetical protein